jgi:hypothetical protein
MMDKGRGDRGEIMKQLLETKKQRRLEVIGDGDSDKEGDESDTGDVASGRDDNHIHAPQGGYGGGTTTNAFSYGKKTLLDGS